MDWVSKENRNLTFQETMCSFKFVISMIGNQNR